MCADAGASIQDSPDFTKATIMSGSARLKNIPEDCPISDKSSRLPDIALPTSGDIIRYWRLLKHVKYAPGKIPPRTELISTLTSGAISIWESASIPVMTPYGIEKKVNSLIDGYRSLSKSFKRDGERTNFKVKLDNYNIKLCELFDISSCVCKSFDTCKYPKELKVPKQEQLFLRDQPSFQQPYERLFSH